MSDSNQNTEVHEPLFKCAICGGSYWFECRSHFTKRIAELEEALRNVALQSGSYLCEGDDGPVIRCLYCSGDDDPCIACQVNTFLGDEEYAGKGARCDRDYLVREGWKVGVP